MTLNLTNNSGKIHMVLYLPRITTIVILHSSPPTSILRFNFGYNRSSFSSVFLSDQNLLGLQCRMQRYCQKTNNIVIAEELSNIILCVYLSWHTALFQVFYNPPMSVPFALFIPETSKANSNSSVYYHTQAVTVHTLLIDANCLLNRLYVRGYESWLLSFNRC